MDEQDMNRKTRNLYAPIYKRAMKADQQIYGFMYARIPAMIRRGKIFEIAIGPARVFCLPQLTLL